MKRYWDTSALVDALHDSRIESLALEPDQWTRPHTLTEAFSTLTGGRLGFKYLPSDAAAMLREITAGFNLVELDAKETLAALDEAEKRGVRGGRVHDWLHARAAKKAGVTLLLTDNLNDFTGLEDGFQIEPP
jgi:predicted nucleic acid-binding protein